MRLPVRRSHTLVNARRIKMSGTRAAEPHQRRRRKRGIVGDPDTRPLDPSSSSTDPNPKRSKTTSVIDNENLADWMNVVAKTKIVIFDTSYADPAKTKVIGKVVRYTNILGAPFPGLLNEDGKLIDSGQIITAQKQLERKNDIYVAMVSWGHCVTSKDRYITIVSTVAETAVIYLGFEYRSVHDGDRRGFTVKPTAKYVDECLDIVQLQNANAVMTPLTEQKGVNLHGADVCDKMLVIQTCVTNTCRFDTCPESVEIFERNT